METIDDVRERLPIEQIVGERVALKRAGASLKGLCPFHNEKTPSFIVTPSKGIYKCFACGEGGDIFTFVMKTQNMDFPTALRELAARAGVEVEDARQGRASGALETRIYDLNAAAATYFQSMLAAPAGTRAREYLERRRIAATTVERFALGYAPDARDGLCARLRAAGHPDEDIVAAGLGIVSDEGGPIRDRFRGRLIFPIRDAKGRILGFGGRVMGEGEPKYLNSPATAVFDKSRVLYTIEHAADTIRSSREAVVVEGYVDALRAHQEGFPNVVATLGTAITEYHLRALKRLAPRLVLALDADPAGQKAAVRAGLAALGTLSADTRTQGRDATQVQIFVATLPQGQDPDDAIAADPDVWRRAVAEAAPLMDHYFALVEAGLDRTRAEWRQEALDTLTPAIGQLPGLGLQQSYIERLSTLTGIDARYLRDITPGGAPPAATRGRDTRRRGTSGTAPAAPPQVDSVRVTEEYLAGLLLLHRPLPQEVRDELASFTPSSVDLAPLFAALPRGMELSAEDEELVERLTAAVARQPAVPSDKVLTVLRVCLLRLAGERTRREIIQFGHTVTEVDSETAREMDGPALQALTLKEQLVARLQKEQSQQWRRPVAAGDSE